MSQTLIADSYYGTVGLGVGHAKAVYADTHKNRQIVAQGEENCARLSTNAKCGACFGAVTLFGLIGIIICAANRCFSSELNTADKAGCDMICDTTIKVVTIVMVIIGCVGTCVSCFTGK